MLNFSKVAVVAELGQKLEVGLNYAKRNKNATREAVVVGEQLLQQVQEVLAGRVEFNEYTLNHDIMKYLTYTAHNEKGLSWKDVVRLRHIGPNWTMHDLADALGYKYYSWNDTVYLTGSGSKGYKVCLAKDVK